MLQRHQETDGFALVVIADDKVSHIPFKDDAAMTVFQHDMEEVLVHTGWVLQSCEPERRKKRDRRRFPRASNDRRRWWTDPVDDSSAVGARERRSSKERADKDRS